MAAVGSIDGARDWRTALCDLKVMIHLATRVHVMKDAAVDSLAEFLKVNLYGTENLARQAKQARVSASSTQFDQGEWQAYLYQ